MKWEAEWLFNNVMHRRHGSTGTVLVSAQSVPEARENAKDEVSRKLCGGTTAMQDYVVVRKLTEVRH